MMFEICKEENIEEPELIDMGYAFRVNIYCSERQWKTVQETPKTVQETIPLSKSELAVLRLLSNNQKMTIKELSSVLNISTSGIKYILSSLKAKGILRRVGPTKSGEWKVMHML